MGWWRGIDGTPVDPFDLLHHPLRTQTERVARCFAMADDLGLSVQNVRIRHVPHHLAHAASAFLSAPAEDALVITLDGKGDGLSGIVARGRGPALDPLAAMDYRNSVGHLYSAFTVACGYTAGRHEGKVTALAGHGQVDAELYQALRERFWFDPSVGTIRGKLNQGLSYGPYPHTPYADQVDRVRTMIGPRDTETAAATLQAFVEELVVELVEHHLTATGATELAVAGGLFANVSVNRRLAAVANTLYVHPAMSDAGLAVGAATYAYSEEMGVRPPEMRSAALGPEYPSNQAIAPFRRAGFHVLTDVDAESHLATALAQGEVVARFVGRAEYGPRALGNRSILAPAVNPDLPLQLNQRLRRSVVMPFAPMTLAEDAHDLYENVSAVAWSARYMTVAVTCRQQMIDQSPAAVHVDGTARPQLVGPEDGRLHRLLRGYRDLTGRASIINTSLNLHEEPMALSPDDVVRCVLAAGIGTVQVGEYVCVAGSGTGG